MHLLRSASRTSFPYATLFRSQLRLRHHLLQRYVPAVSGRCATAVKPSRLKTRGRAPSGALSFFLRIHRFGNGVHRAVEAFVISESIAIDLLKGAEVLLGNDEVDAVEKRGVPVERAQI